MVGIPSVLFVSSAAISATALTVALAAPLYDVGPFTVGAVKIGGPVDVFVPDSKERTIAFAISGLVFLVALSMLVNFVDKNIARLAHLFTALLCIILALVGVLLIDTVVALPMANTLDKFLPQYSRSSRPAHIVAYTLIAISILAFGAGFFMKNRGKWQQKSSR
jgi:hypothetical protein